MTPPRLLRALSLLLAGVAIAGPTRAAPDAAQLRLEARLFHSASGSFSNNLLAPGAPELVNVVASADPSTATLVLVAVALAPGTALRSQTPVRLTVREQPRRGGVARVILDRSQPLAAVARGGTTYLAFWLQDTGCRTLQLRATMTVVGQSVAPAVAATLPFACSE